MKNILLPYDFSDAARQAVPYAFELAARTGATLHIFCAEVLYGDPSSSARASTTARDGTRETLRQAIEEQARGAYAPDGVMRVYAVRRDIAADAAILRYAAAQDIDLIVMGTHGRRGLRRLALGSVTEKVIRRAPRPVLTVKERTAKPVGLSGITRILVPTDFSAPSREALRHAKTLAARLGAQVELFHAVEETLHPAFYSPVLQSIYDAQPNIEAKVVEQLKEFYRTTEGRDGEVTFKAGPGPVPRAIARRARAGHAGLIVMAAGEGAGLAPFNARGTAEKVVREAPCSVLTVRSSEEKARPSTSGGAAAEGTAPAMTAAA